MKSQVLNLNEYKKEIKSLDNGTLLDTLVLLRTMPSRTRAAALTNARKSVVVESEVFERMK